MAFISWYHEIAMCGTDKIAMSLTILSNSDGRRSFWMLPFEAYFGILIKFVNPCCLMFLFFESLAKDLQEPYGMTDGVLPVFASIYVFIAFLIIIIPMFMCDYPELFDHNVEKEFIADDIFEVKARMKKKLQGAFANKGKLKNMLKKKMEGQGGNVEMQNNSALPLHGQPN